MKNQILLLSLAALFITMLCNGQAIDFKSRATCKSVLCKATWRSYQDTGQQKNDFTFLKNGKCTNTQASDGGAKGAFNQNPQPVHKVDTLVWYFDTTDARNAVRCILIGRNQDDALQYFLVDVSKLKSLSDNQITKIPVYNLPDIKEMITDLGARIAQYKYILVLGRTLHSTYNKVYYHQ